MAEAIIRGLIDTSTVPPTSIFVSEPSEDRRNILSTALGIQTTKDPAHMLSNANVVFIAVKPDIVPFIMRDIRNHEDALPEPDKLSTLYISICAGVKLDALNSDNSQRRCVRVMPNQPCLVGEAASAFSMSPTNPSHDRDTVHTLLGACGLVVELPEKNLDAVTGLSGSGPAFVFMMIESMADAAVRNGMPRPVARSLAAQTVLGAAKMVLNEPNVHPAEFRNRVESPGGTTIAGTSALERAGFRAAVIDAVSAATQRSAELGRK